MLKLNYSADLRAEFPANVGLVVQAYLRRTLQDIKNLQDLNSAGIPFEFQAVQGNLY